MKKWLKELSVGDKVLISWEGSAHEQHEVDFISDKIVIVNDLFFNRSTGVHTAFKYCKIMPLSKKPCGWKVIDGLQ